MAEYKCGNCIHADVCEESETLVGFSRENNAYCGMFLNSADVAPVRHGRWTWTEDDEEDWEQFYRCSNCGEKEYCESNYCPNCGARMDLEET